MTVRKAILVELFAILLVLYAGLLNISLNMRAESLWLMTLGLFVGIFAAVQGFLSDPSSPDQGLSTDTDSERADDGISAWITGIFLLSVSGGIGVGGAMVGRLLGLPFGTSIGGISGAIVAFLGIAWAYYGR